jgi:hypothetical protein
LQTGRAARNFHEGFERASDARVGAGADIVLFIDISSNFLIRCTVGMVITSRLFSTRACPVDE